MTPDIDQFDVCWDSPSRDASGSMPIGNGDCGANVWIEPSGDLVLLLSKVDAWDEHGVLLKVGRVRIRFSPNALVGTGVRFRQRLCLRTASIEVEVGDGNERLGLRIWADANHPVIHVQATADPPVAIECALEMWRTQPRQIKTQTGDLFKNLDGPDPHPTIIQPDVLLPPAEGRIVWCHHNRRLAADPFEINLRLQGLGDWIDRMTHPLVGRTWGAAIEGEGLVSQGDSRLVSPAPRRSHHVRVHMLSLHPATAEQWQERLDEQIRSVSAGPIEAAWEAHCRWWEAFWSRSWIVLRGEGDAAEEAHSITRAWLVQRYMNAAAGRAMPIKHNGSIFSVGKPDDPDFRRWGGPAFWFMNQRLIYWPMIASGDWDLIEPWIAMYRRCLELARDRTRRYFRHGGAHYPETITPWGSEISAHYGWTPFDQRDEPVAECPYVRYYWSGGIELTLILWTIWHHRQDERFAGEMLLPMADAITTFYDEHYPRDGQGKIRFEPAQALETWHEAVNPLPEIAGLRYLLTKLLELPERLTTAAQRQRWSRMLDELPPVPRGAMDGFEVLLPAERYDRLKNTENPELYAVFPYRLFGVGKQEQELARQTFAVRRNRAHTCWSQDDIHAALLGLSDEVRAGLAERASPASHSDSRFPGFWNAFKDWLPDVDHGGVLQMALQLALMQCEGRRILLLPAWPERWDADFRLHAPYATVVEGCVRGGRIVSLRVTPEARRSDVEVCNLPLDKE